eukprot:COSAG01_NODE_12913_length_1664_cov_1.644089_2_plen_141_part_00
MELSSGSVIIFHDLLLHASNPNVTGADRYCMIPTYRSRRDEDPDPLGVWPVSGGRVHIVCGRFDWDLPICCVFSSRNNGVETTGAGGGDPLSAGARLGGGLRGGGSQGRQLPLTFREKREYKLFETLLPAAAAHESYTFA